MNTRRWTTVIAMGFVSLALLTGCSRSADQKVADAKAQEVAAKQDVKAAVGDAQEAARADWVKFKSEAEAQIAANDQLIADYRVKMKTADHKLHEQYEKKIDALHERNDALKEKLENYQDDGTDKSEQFKREFNHDMNELGTALKNFFDNDGK